MINNIDFILEPEQVIIARYVTLQLDDIEVQKSSLIDLRIPYYERCLRSNPLCLHDISLGIHC